MSGGGKSDNVPAMSAHAAIYLEKDLTGYGVVELLAYIVRQIVNSRGGVSLAASKTYQGRSRTESRPPGV